MSNTRHTNPAAAMNGTKRPTSLQVLEVIAGGIQALAQDATRKPAGQRWHCAVCLGLMKAWELRHQEDLQVIVGQYQDRMTEFAAAFNNPDLDPAARQAMMGSQPDMQQMCAAYGQQAGDPMPQVNEANAIATLPETGTCGLCATHVPPARAVDPDRRSLLIAQGPLSSGMIAQVRGG